MTPPACPETRLDATGRTRRCVLDDGHDGDHQDAHCHTWEPVDATLARLTERWGDTHRIAWSGSFWLATARDRRARWRSHVEPTSEQLEASLRRHTGHPPVPAQRRHRDHL